MSSFSTMEELRDLGLMPHQAELVQDVVQASLPVRRLLVAGAGFGKTFAAVSVARQIIKANPSHRILIITPRVRAAIHEHQFGQAALGKSVTFVDRRKFRELEAAVEQGQPIWPSPITAVIGMDMAMQKDVLAQLCSVSWDLVLVEEVHLYGRSQWTLLKTILSNKAFQRVLLMTATHDMKSSASLLKGVVLTNWVTAELKDWDGRQLFPNHAIKFSTVSYRRSDAEVALLQNLLQLTKKLSPSPVGKLVKKVLLKQASSSPIALERTIKRLRNTLLHDHSEFLLEPGTETRSEIGSEGLDTGAGLPATLSQAVWQNKSRALTVLNYLIDLTESLLEDKKREALESLLSRLEPDGLPGRPQICIFCSAKATANYLQTILEERGHKSWLLTGDQTSQEVRVSFDGFRTEGGTLVCTPIVLLGFDLREVKTFIHYDPPSNNPEMWLRVTRSPDATHYLLKDESGILPNEWTVSDFSKAMPTQQS